MLIKKIYRKIYNTIFILTIILILNIIQLYTSIDSFKTSIITSNNTKSSINTKYSNSSKETIPSPLFLYSNSKTFDLFIPSSQILIYNINNKEETNSQKITHISIPTSYPNLINYINYEYYNKNQILAVENPSSLLKYQIISVSYNDNNYFTLDSKIPNWDEIISSNIAFSIYHTNYTPNDNLLIISLPINSTKGKYLIIIANKLL